MPSHARLRVALALIAILAAATPSAGVRAGVGDRPIEYRVAITRPTTQMVDVSMTVLDVERRTLDVAMPTWRPGKYEILDPAGTVREVRAFDGDGTPLPIEKIRKSVWRITTGGAETVRVDYRIFADSLRDRTRHVDDTHAFLSGESVFMFPMGRREDASVIHIEAPEHWSVASGLEPAEGDDRTLLAPNYDVLVDTPIEVGEHEVIEFEVSDTPHEIVLWGEWDECDRERLVEDFSKIVEVQRDIFGELPYERYVFLVHVGRGAGGGTEHLNSTIMQTRSASIEGSVDNSGAYQRLLGLVSHEFFHTWNVKQFRPAGIQPYDYLTENYTKLLWVAEGTTSYYDDLTLARAGLMKESRYFDRIADSIGGFLQRPGRKIQSLEESSFDAWIKFTKGSQDDYNTEISFYSHGAMVSLVLDMRLRETTGNRVSLDDVMRTLYQRYPLSGPGYTPSDLQSVVEELAGTSFESFFQRYVRGREDPDFKQALRTVGLEFYFDADGDESEDGDDDATDADDSTASDDAVAMKADLGVSLSGNSIRRIDADGAAMKAGLMVGDELLAVDGERIRSTNDLNNALADLEPGDEITLAFFRRDELREITVVLGGTPDGEWKIRRVDDPTDEQVAAYESWIGQTWPGLEGEGDDVDNKESAANDAG